MKDVVEKLVWSTAMIGLKNELTSCASVQVSESYFLHFLFRFSNAHAALITATVQSNLTLFPIIDFIIFFSNMKGSRCVSDFHNFSTVHAVSMSCEFFEFNQYGNIVLCYEIL